MPDPRPLSFARVAALGAVVVLALSACASTPAGWTYAPQPSITPPPSSGQRGAVWPGVGRPLPPASAAPSTPGGSVAPPPSGGQGGPVVQLSAENIAFDKSSIQAPAGQPWSIDFDNKDAGIPHNVAIKDQSGNQVLMGEIVTGPVQTTYQVPALPAGPYTFVCDVHPNMTGILDAQ